MDSETTPLLAENAHRPRLPSSTANPASLPGQKDGDLPLSSWASKASTHWKVWATVYLCALLIFVVDFPEFMRVAPRLRLYELTICREYYRGADPSVIGPDGHVPEGLCKLDAIQSSLANLRGIMGLLEAVPGLVLAIPYGILADRRGRRLVVALGVTGQVLGDTWIFVVLTFFKTFPTSAVYSASLFRIVGGGSSVLSAVLFAIIADATPSNARTRIFFYLAVVMLVSEVISPPLGSRLLDQYGPNHAYLFSLPFQLLGLTILPLLPGHVAISKGNEGEHDQAIQEIQEGGESISPPLESSMRPRDWSALTTQLAKDIWPILRQATIALGLLALLLNRFSRPLFEFLMQYMSVRFGWTLSQTAYLISIQALAHILALSVILPPVHYWLTTRYKEANAADLALSQGSIVFLILGTLGMGFSPYSAGVIISILLFTLGTGFTQALRSFLTSIVPRDDLALLYTMISFADSVGSLCASPVLALAFSAGLKVGGLLAGLPFLVAAFLYGISALSVWSIRTPRSR